MATVVPWVDLLLDVPKSILGENGLPIEAKESFGILMDKLNMEFSFKKILDDYPNILDQLSNMILSLRRTKNPDRQTNGVAAWLKQLEIALGESHMAARKMARRCKSSWTT